MLDNAINPSEYAYISLAVVHEDFRKSKLYKEVYEGKSLGDVIPIEE